MRLSYFPGCTLKGSVREYDLATRAVAEALDIELVELTDWNCCGGVSAASLSQGALEALGRRNLERVPEDAPELLCPCPHCYTSLARALSSVAEEVPGQSAVRLRSILDVFADAEVLARLVDKRVEPLTDLTMVGYYGCKLTRPDPEAAGLAAVSPSGEGSPVEGPGPIERIIEACGATPVEWSAASDCCGSVLGVADVEVAEELLGRVYRAVLDVEAEAIVVACPLCHLNLDIRQHQVSQRLGRGVDIPVFFVTELMAVSLGMEESEAWLDRHVTSPLSMFIKFVEAEQEREYWGEEGTPSSDRSQGEADDEGPAPAAEAPSDEASAKSGEQDAATDGPRDP